MSRSLKIPAVVGLHNATEKIKPNDYLLIDGYEGLVFINPTSDTLKEYDEIASKQLEIERTFQEELVEKTETLDGHSIELMANIEASDDISESVQDSFDGIGLFRTESIYLKKNGMPSEEEQFEEYTSVAKNAKGKPVIIRTLDIGGDKLINGVHDDSFLGLRAIRFCLENLTIFKTQLRAILRASVFGDIRIMYPMISGTEELDKANFIFNEVKEQLLSEKIAFNPKIQVGAMIELPSAVSIIDLLAKKVDFFSVGTNDLIQYLMAVDRMDDRVSHLYQPTHPAVLRSLKVIFEQSESNQKPVCVCGEMAGEPIYALLLIGLGARSLSASISRLPEIKHYIRLINLGELKELINELMTLDQAEPIEQKLSAFLEKIK
jgi:phosphotransferase system enzyme I (PtsI)